MKTGKPVGLLQEAVTGELPKSALTLRTSEKLADPSPYSGRNSRDVKRFEDRFPPEVILLGGCVLRIRPAKQMLSRLRPLYNATLATVSITL
ncbi:MAG TPA: hypothetical protein VEW46_13345 [Pyrinomonadaceae bacterium]|nr:hypothetical protein [Pyrinomonadaceae bacterium]